MITVNDINALAARGVQLWLADGKLQYKAPREEMTPALLETLKQNKATIIELLTQFGASAGTYPLSYAQKSLWSLHELHPESAAYNVFYAARIADDLDAAALGRCIDYLVARHPILRTTYRVHDGEPQQKVTNEASAPLRIEHLAGAGEAQIRRWIEQQANRPFDLTVSPVRLTLLVNDRPAGTAARRVLLFNVHHIAADFWSLEIFIRELSHLYRMARHDEPLKLAPLRLQYKDCVAHEAQRLQGAEGAALARFWQTELQRELPVLALPTDKPRPPVKTENGKVHVVDLPERLARSMREIARQFQVTPYMLLLSVYQLLLLQHTGQRRLLIGAPTAGRSAEGSEEVMGHFVNTVVLSCRPDPAQTFRALVAETRTLMSRVLDHADYPFPMLVDKLRPRRDPSRSPLFQVMFNWNQARRAAPADDALLQDVLAASSTGTRGATHDLTLNIYDFGPTCATAWTFNTDLFEERTIDRLASQYIALLEQVLADASRPLSSYRLIGRAARSRQLEMLAQAPAADPTPPAARFAALAEHDPERLAADLGGRRITYGELHAQMHALHALHARSTAPCTGHAEADAASVLERAIAALASQTTGAAPAAFVEGVRQALQIDATSRVLALPASDPLALGQVLAVLSSGASLHAPRELHDASDIGPFVREAGITVLTMPALALPVLADADIASLATLALTGPYLHASARLPERPGLALRLLANLERQRPPVALQREGDDWVLCASNALPVVLGRWGDLADDGDAGRLWLGLANDLADRTDPADRDALAAPALHDAPPDLRGVLASLDLVETPFIAHRRPDGRVVCVSRAARSVQAREVPVSLDALERFLSRQAGVRQALCVSAPDQRSHVAYIVPSDAGMSVDDLKKRLRQGLPEEMHPRALVLLERLPLDAAGALDEERLPEPAADTQARPTEPRNPIEAALARLWAEVLGLETVGIHDNFFELGGDSIQGAIIISKAGLEGLHFAPKDIFENMTIAELAQVVRSAPEVEIDQGPVEGEAAMGPAAAWFFDHVDTDVSHFNQGLLLQLSEAPELQTMARAVELLTAHHDALGSHFVDTPQGWRQRFAPSAAPVFCSVDIGSGEDTSRRDTAVLAAQRSLDIERGPLWRVLWLDAGDLARSRLLIVAHHLVIDGLSWSILLQDLNQVYFQLKAGEAPQLPRKTASFKSWVEQRQALASGGIDGDERAHWQRFAQRAAASDAWTPAARLSNRESDADRMSVALDAELTSRFRTQAHQAYNTDANDLLLAALASAFAAWRGGDAVRIDAEGHGRDGSLDIGRTIGWFTSIYPVLLATASREDPQALIKSVKETLRELPHKGNHFGTLRYLANDAALAALPQAPMLFTYLGTLDQLAGQAPLYAGAVEPAPGIRSARQRRTHEFDVCAYVAAGRLTIECAFDATRHTRSEMHDLLEGVRDRLAGLISHCCADGAGGLTPSDLPDLEMNQDELDALLEEIDAVSR